MRNNGPGGKHGEFRLRTTEDREPTEEYQVLQPREELESPLFHPIDRNAPRVKEVTAQAENLTDELAPAVCDFIGEAS
jgi:hypothetical protein